MIFTAFALAHGPGNPCDEPDWGECAAEVEAHGGGNPAYAVAAAEACALDALDACAFASVYAPSQEALFANETKVATLRKAACVAGETHWCKHATTGDLYVRVGPRHALFDGGSPAWLELADPVLKTCKGEACFDALSWSVQRSAMLCRKPACKASALQLREAICTDGGYALACLRTPHKKRTKACTKGNAEACLERALTGFQGDVDHDGTGALRRACELGEDRACKLEAALVKTPGSGG